MPNQDEVLFVMLRDRTIASTTGHSVEFKKNVPTYVPKEMWAEVQALGAVPSTELENPPAPPETPADPEERKTKVFDAFKKMMEEGKREAFGASGVPTTRALEEITSFNVPAAERDALWQEFQLLKKED